MIVQICSLLLLNDYAFCHQYDNDQQRNENQIQFSSFKGNGAIPGFTFENKEAAELFIKIKDGDGCTFNAIANVS